LRGLALDIDMLDEAVAARLGVTRSDARGLGILVNQEPMAVGELAAAVGLTYPAASALIDRMERTGYVTRTAQPSDKRRILVQTTERARREADAIFADLIAAFVRLAGGYTDAELELLTRFIAANRAILRTQATRIRSEASRQSPGHVAQAGPSDGTHITAQD